MSSKSCTRQHCWCCSYADASNATTATVPAQNSYRRRPRARAPTPFRVIDKDGGSTVYTEMGHGHQRHADRTARRCKRRRGLAPATVGDAADAGDLPTIHDVYDLDGNATDDTVGVAYANATAATTAIVPANSTPMGLPRLPCASGSSTRTASNDQHGQRDRSQRRHGDYHRPGDAEVVGGLCRTLRSPTSARTP